MELTKGAPGERGRSGTRLRTGGSLIVRSLLWVVISSGFLVWNLHRILQMRALKLHVAWWAYIQVVLWMFALGFWLWTGWKDFRRRDSRPG